MDDDHHDGRTTARQVRSIALVGNTATAVTGWLPTWPRTSIGTQLSMSVPGAPTSACSPS